MALKRLGLQTTTITEEETSITGPDDKVFETFEVKNVEENKSKKKSEINEICSENDTTKSSFDEGIEKKDASKIKIVKKRLNFDGTNDENEVIESSKEITSNDTPKSDTGQEDFFDSNILGVPKDPDSDFLSMILPLKSELIKLNGDSLIVILSGMRFFDQMTMIKKLLFFQNRFFLERVCHVVNEPIGTSYNVTDLVHLDYYQIDPELLKNVIFKAHHGICSNMTLSIGTEWPMNLVIKKESVNLIEKASSLLLEIELVKWKLGELYKDLLTSKKGMYSSSTFIFW